MQSKSSNKEKRIDKEIFLLRNLPKPFKMGKKETQLGILIDVSYFCNSSSNWNYFVVGNWQVNCNIKAFG